MDAGIVVAGMTRSDELEELLSERQKAKDGHPVAQAIDGFLHLVQDIEFAEKVFVPVSVKIERNILDKLKSGFDEGDRLIEEDDPLSNIIGIRKSIKAMRYLDRCSRSDVPRTLMQSLFLSLFSGFDAFVANLLTALFERKPLLFNRLDRPMTFADILEFENLQEAKQAALRSEIDRFRRKGYQEQVAALEELFGIPLAEFSRWPQFVEASLRLALLAEHDGIVTDQYLDACSSVGYQSSRPLVKGDRLEIDSAYFIATCDLMIEGAVKLGQTLWRRLLPEELSRADAHLNDILYTFLEVENWNRAMVFGEFAAGQPKASTDLRRKMFLVNYAIALKFGGREDKARDILANIDWTAASNDFKLAQAVILEQYDAAAEIMRKIGTAGELVSEHSYHLWPLFHDFRESDPFHRGYAAVYGYPFKEEFKKVIAAARAGELKELEHGAATERNRG